MEQLKRMRDFARDCQRCGYEGLCWSYGGVEEFNKIHREFNDFVTDHDINGQDLGDIEDVISLMIYKAEQQLAKE